MVPSLRVDPVPYLLGSGPAVVYFARRELLGDSAGSLEGVWRLPEVARLLRGQNVDGSWGRPGGYPPHHRPMFETFKHLRLLVGRYELNGGSPQVEAASEFIFGTQTPGGDFRGMLGDQYATYYTGEFTGLLVRAGYGDDERVDRAFRWLVSMRQEDGGWTVPILTLPPGGGAKRTIMLTGTPAEPVEPDRSKPFSHNCTDMVLRAFAAHPRWRRSPEARHAATLLKSRFFKPDAYTSHRNPNYWVRFIHWWPNLLTSLESLSRFGFKADDPDMERALLWFVDNQEPDGSWRTSYFPGNAVNTRLEPIERAWVTLRVARMFRSFTQDRRGRLPAASDPYHRSII
jgi:hypothetical protein